jgi:hypothetical protein
MDTSKKPTENLAECSNKSKPLLCDVFPINEIELKGGYLEFFDEEIVLKALNNIEKIIDDSLLLAKEDFHVKIRLFLKLKKEMEALHTLIQSENFFNEGTWNYKRESLSRRC